MAGFSTRVGWEDIIPIPQDDGPNPIVPIAYSNSCKLDFSFIPLFLLNSLNSLIFLL